MRRVSSWWSSCRSGCESRPNELESLDVDGLLGAGLRLDDRRGDPHYLR